VILVEEVVPSFGAPDVGPLDDARHDRLVDLIREVRIQLDQTVAAMHGIRALGVAQEDGDHLADAGRHALARALLQVVLRIVDRGVDDARRVARHRHPLHHPFGRATLEGRDDGVRHRPEEERDAEAAAVVVEQRRDGGDDHRLAGARLAMPQVDEREAAQVVHGVALRHRIVADETLGEPARPVLGVAVADDLVQLDAIELDPDHGPAEVGREAGDRERAALELVRPAGERLDELERPFA
jgi:hypothetical protein